MVSFDGYFTIWRLKQSSLYHDCWLFTRTVIEEIFVECSKKKNVISCWETSYVILNGFPEPQGPALSEEKWEFYFWEEDAIYWDSSITVNSRKHLLESIPWTPPSTSTETAIFSVWKVVQVDLDLCYSFQFHLLISFSLRRLGRKVRRAFGWGKSEWGRGNTDRGKGEDEEGEVWLLSQLNRLIMHRVT